MTSARALPEAQAPTPRQTVHQTTTLHVQRCGGHACPPGGCGHEAGTVSRLSRSGGATPGLAPPVVADALAGPSADLPAPLRGTMQSRLGHDFATVRVHSDHVAARAADAVGARAFTVGRHIVVGPGQWAPETPEGQHLISHELAHVVQQRGAPEDVGARPLRLSAPTDAGEVEAERVATSHSAHPVPVTTREPVVSRLPFGITLPSGLRSLDPTEEAQGRAVYAGSITYADVKLSDATGGGGRPFTTVAPLGYIVINVGKGLYGTPGSNRRLIVHELAHVWQSQHHPVPTAFMNNSVASQAGAAITGASSYCYVPGKPFSSYAAEQIAQSAQNGEAAIIAHMAGVSAGSVDPDNVLSLALPRWETSGTPGVRC